MNKEPSKNLLSDIIEATIDGVIENDFIKSIPIIGSIRNLIKTGQSISDYLLAKKISTFLSALNELSEEKQFRVIKKIDEDDDYKERLGLQLIEIINRCDNHEKPRLIAKLFRAYLTGEIEVEDFYKYSQIINNAHYADLIKLSQMPTGITEVYEVNSLMALGLIELKSKNLGNSEVLGGIGKTNKIEYVLNKYGQELYKLIR